MKNLGKRLHLLLTKYTFFLKRITYDRFFSRRLSKLYDHKSRQGEFYKNELHARILIYFFFKVLESYPTDILVFIPSLWQLRDLHSHVIMLYLILVF